MKPAKIFSILVVLIIGTYGLIGLYFLPLAGFEGGSTRMAMLPESLFGWNAPKPALSPELFKATDWQDADVLVIGDSFSEPRIWQSVLVKQGLHVRTLHWTNVRGICEDFYPWVRAQGFKGKWVVFEAVERNIAEGVPKEANCKKVVYHPSIHSDGPRQPPVATRPGNEWSGRLSVGIETALNARDYERLSDLPDFKKAGYPNGVFATRVQHGCELFSHARCDDVLFLGDSAADVDARVLDDVERINARLNDITPIWAFVPNKSTAYLYPDKQFWNKAEVRVHAPNLLRMTQRAIQEKTVDLYPANDTHFSTVGYLLMGEEILKAMQQAGLKVPSR